MADSNPVIGVVIVTFNSALIIDECLESVFSSTFKSLRVVIVDNASTDSTCDVVQNWATGRTAFHPRDLSPLGRQDILQKPLPFVLLTTAYRPPETFPLTLLRAEFNGGYAYAVNLGLKFLCDDASISSFWILNPDCVVPADTASAIAQASLDNDYSLMGGRTLQYDRPDEIQTDGGVVSRLTGRCRSLNMGKSSSTTPLPDSASIDFITGAHFAVSRKFIERVGLMTESYFLYYEEVDWAFRRGTLPMRIIDGAIVFHRGGTAVGSGSARRRASPFANYFNYRNRQRFVRRFLPLSLPLALAFACAKAFQLMLLGATDEAAAIFTGALGLAPPPEVRTRINGPEAQQMAFGSSQDD
jgi:GT2 family glycosyltransferase